MTPELKQAIEDLTGDIELAGRLSSATVLKSDLKMVLAALEAYRVDAERYRLWREKYCLAMLEGEEIDPVLLALADAWTPADCDSILDAARKEKA